MSRSKYSIVFFVLLVASISLHAKHGYQSYHSFFIRKGIAPDLIELEIEETAPDHEEKNDLFFESRSNSSLNKGKRLESNFSKRVHSRFTKKKALRKRIQKSGFGEPALYLIPLLALLFIVVLLIGLGLFLLVFYGDWLFFLILLLSL